MREFYPETPAFNQFHLKVSDTHEIYVEEGGNPNGTPVIMFHGGPGSQFKAKYRQFYNPEKYRIIGFDQRGCGQSTPKGEIKENTTQDAIADAEKIREHLKIEKWHVLGGSWGSTLALLYSETYPERVSSLQVRGIYTCRKWENDWLLKGGPAPIFPENWQQLIELIPTEKRNNLAEYILAELVSANRDRQYQLAQAWGKWEGGMMKLLPDPEEKEEEEQDPTLVEAEKDKEIASARIFFHYMANNCFLKEGEILNNAAKLKNTPGVIIHGRYDLVCPVSTAFDLHKAWPEADFFIAPDAGHHSSEPGLVEKSLEYSDKFAELN